MEPHEATSVLDLTQPRSSYGRKAVFRRSQRSLLLTEEADARTLLCLDTGQ